MTNHDVLRRELEIETNATSLEMRRAALIIVVELAA
jgi:hypothetical protein